MAVRRHFLVLAAFAILLVGAGTWVAVTSQLPGQRATATQPGASEHGAEIRQTLFTEVQPVNVTNCQLQRFGEPHDGGYLLCANLLGAVQTGYSYGISGYDGWGCDVSRRLHVTVHQYDCFDLRQPPCPEGRTVFHGECVGTKRSVEEGRPFDTLAGQFAKNGDEGRRLVVKMDVEGAEWDSLLLAPDAVFRQIDQLEVEFHRVDQQKFVAAVQRLRQFFYVAHIHYNNFSCDPNVKPFPSWAFEVLFVSRRVATSEGSRAPAGPIAIDAANNPGAPDCQVPG